ncbi:ABC transporter substrate-binding protein [Temperatibacter marinus]|uniref:ABC transporter substrate-binding protein n=1 Tax=Temperatibacter marinus TaxID=1456591 RepID=A0AA52EH59_9PROT|nr:ABC transporter substrate-binding protein [Temperatibacter marinus]WND02434.1 ABC transporter substrate-binding protein [Temperatibacter marinus]
MKWIAKQFVAICVATVFFTALDVSAQNKDRAVDDQEGALAFVEKLANDTTNVWSNAAVTKADRDAAFFSLFEEATDINYIAKVMMGRQYLKIPKDKFKDYVKAVRSFIIFEFDKRMTQIGFQKLTVTGVTPLLGKRGTVKVNSTVQRTDGPDLEITWRVDKRKGQFKVINMTVDGVNMVLVNRDYFQDRMKKVGIDGLIKELQDKNQKASS